jgi:hypothetical protein
VYERLNRAGVRDWELEWDYVECSYWFMRRNLEVIAREVFRIWYGEGKWEEPFRTACHLQETGTVEYRIDHLLTSELDVEVRKRPANPDSPSDGRRRPRFGELRRDLRGMAPSLMAPGEYLKPKEIAGRLAERVEYRVHPVSTYSVLKSSPDVFERRSLRSGHEHLKVHFAVRAPSTAVGA